MLKITLISLIFISIFSLYDADAALMIPGYSINCDVEVSSITSFLSPSLPIDTMLKDTYGGENVIQIVSKEYGGYFARIENKVGVLELLVLVTYNYLDKRWEFAGGNFAGTMKGYLLNCRSFSN